MYSGAYCLLPSDSQETTRYMEASMKPLRCYELEGLTEDFFAPGLGGEFT